MARKNTRAGGAVFSASSQPEARKPRRAGGNKARAEKAEVPDTYTFTAALPKRHRTGAAQMSLSREEADEGPRRRHNDDEDEDDDMQARIRKVAMMIAADEAGEVEDTDDEDVDSDAAWESEGSDEDRWGDVFRQLEKGKGKKGKEVVRKPAKPIAVNLDESESESDPEVERSPRTAFKSAFPEEEDEDEDEEDEEEEDEDDDEGSEDEDVEMDAESDDADSESEAYDEDPELPSDLSDDEGDLDGLDAFVDGLTSADKKRKAEDEDTVDTGKKRRVLPVVSGPGLADAGDLGLKNKTKVDLSSLIASAPTLSGASALLPSKSGKKSTSVLKSGVLSAPLPTTAQERLDREAAYEATKTEGQKWSGVMKRVKEAEHLSFPLQAAARGGVKSAGEVVASFKPENEHESAVQALLAKANLTDSGVTAAEDEALRGQDLSVEEIAARRRELRYQRELMFRAEARAKRVSKIKSKTFRKLARKRAARAAAGDEDQGLSLSDLERVDPEAAEAERERLERERARERATLRHGARSRFGRGEAETDDARAARDEMFTIRDRLQRKIHGKESDESSSESSDDDEGDEDAIKTRAFDQLAALDAKMPKDEGKKGIAHMAFMKKAAEREIKAVREQEADLRREIEMFGDADGKGAADASDSDDDDAHVMKIGEGRMVFSGPIDASAPAPAPKRKSTKAAAAPPQRSPSPAPATGAFGDVNPWLDASTASGPSRKRNTLATSAEARAVRGLKKAALDRAAAEDEERVEIDVAPKPADASKAKSKGKGKESTKGKDKQQPAVPAEPAAADADSDSDSDADELMPISGVKAFTQRELVAEAFAGDDVVADFEAEKARTIAADAPKVEDTTLPGWGSWGGKGAKKRRSANPRFLKTTPGVAPETRKDAQRANVIISEKRDRKASQFLPTDLPYPYTSVAQYEASFRNPVGAEWNARAGFQRQTMPRVVKKPGAIIEPVRKLF